MAGRAVISLPNASFNDIPRFFMRYAAINVGERDTAAEQCTKILLGGCEAIVVMISLAAETA